MFAVSEVGAVSGAPFVFMNAVTGCGSSYEGSEVSERIIVRKPPGELTQICHQGNGVNGWTDRLQIELSARSQSYSPRTKRVHAGLVEMLKTLCPDSSFRRIAVEDTVIREHDWGRCLVIIQLDVFSRSRRGVRAQVDKVFDEIGKLFDKKLVRRPTGSVWYWPGKKDILLEEMELAVADVEGNGA